MSELHFEMTVPPGADRDTPVVVLLHGRGADCRDLLPISPHLPEGTALVAPQAPFPGSEWGYGGGWAWYRYEGEDWVDPTSLEESVAHLDRFLAGLPERLGFEPSTVTLGGFSQGGTTSLAYALQNPGAVAGLIVLSGFLAQAPGIRTELDTVRGMRFFWGHGLQDPMIPHRLAVKGRERLRQAGADLTTRDYRAGHTITLEELRDLHAWLQGAPGAS